MAYPALNNHNKYYHVLDAAVPKGQYVTLDPHNTAEQLMTPYDMKKLRPTPRARIGSPACQINLPKPQLISHGSNNS
jgi:hypothetical protein